MRSFSSTVESSDPWPRHGVGIHPERTPIGERSGRYRWRVSYDWPQADALVLVAAGFGERSSQYDQAPGDRRLSVAYVLDTVDYIHRTVLDAKELDGAIR